MNDFLDNMNPDDPIPFRVVPPRRATVNQAALELQQLLIINRIGRTVSAAIAKNGPEHACVLALLGVEIMKAIGGDQ